MSWSLGQVQLKELGDEMQQLNSGMDKVEKELTASEKDGPVSENFRKVRYCTVPWKVCKVLYNVW